ncbi:MULTISPECIES: dihydrolipoyl dehydrogenase [Bacillus]|uniref:dihydrolipoyl dehydrogenase n=1 Tax=Bacillus TaxID=1386 RepID=UPI00030F9F49|nr:MULTISPECIES: dihydrolipoyl dehydrogenase [Bacillus]
MSTIAIIGGGPAGYVAAIIAAQQGNKVILIEQDSLGGTCLNEGCMPTKSLLQSAEMIHQVKHANDFGIKVNDLVINWNQVQNRKNDIVASLVQGIRYLMRKNKITIIEGKAVFQSPTYLTVDGETIHADKIIIATGSEAVELPFAPFDREWIIDSRQAMSLSTIPESLIIVGGGVIGCEFASIYSAMGTKVTIIEMADQLLPGEDSEVALILQKELIKQGVTLFLGASVKEVDSTNKKVFFQEGQEMLECQSEYLLVSIGRKPRVTKLGLEQIGIEMTKQGIIVNEKMQTNVSNIYACGDVIGGFQLAHVAMHEGKVAALHASGNMTSVNERVVPRCIYTNPEIASVGLTEKQARTVYQSVLVGECPFSMNGKSLILNNRNGKVKVLVEPEYGEIIGLTIVGPHATELIGQGALMIHGEMTVDSLEDFISAHPTLSEAIHEAILQAKGRAIHM